MRSKMRYSPCPTFSSFKLKALTAAVMSLMVLSQAHAAGLGKLTVLSALGQPLRAEIALVGVEPGEAESLVPKLASPEAFQRANIQLNQALFSLKFAIVKQGSRDIIRVTSAQAMNEPFIDMLLELGGNKGGLVREYTFLLDPPEMRKTQSAQFDSSISTRSLPAPSTAESRSTQSSRVTSVAPSGKVTSAPQAAARQATAAAMAPTADDYAVKKGDTLAKIANRYRGSISLDQMLVALYRANPDAFIDENMNRVRAGKILKMPDADTAQATSKSDAHAVVVAQAADFNRYRNRLAEKTAASTAQKSAANAQSSGGKITTEIDEGADAGSSRDKLKLSKAGTKVSAGSDKFIGGASQEDLIAKEKALAEANSRVAELEKNVSELQKLLEFKNQDLAGKQAQADAVAKTAVTNSSDKIAADSAPIETAAKGESTATAPSAAGTTAAPATDTAAAAKTDAVVDKPAATPVKPKRPIVVPPPPPPPSFFEDLTNNAMFLPGAALLLALLAGLGIYSARRRKQPQAFDDSMMNDSSLKTNSLFGSTGGQSVDTNNSVFNSNFVPSASQLDTNEVDPIAEADVYIAYGRDAQAEEILKEALRNQPERHAVRVKLLEIYASRNDARSFEILASELYGMTKGEGAEWQQAANLGLILDPSNPLYASGANAADAGLNAAALTQKTQRQDENLDDLLLTTEGKSEQSDVIQTSPYFNSTTMLTEEALNEPVAPTDAPSESKGMIDDLAFDLDGLENDDINAQAAPVEESPMPPEIADINFDFMDDKKDDLSAQPEVASLHEDDELASFESTDTADTAEVSLPDLDMTDMAAPQSESASVFDEKPSEALPDLDLSDIAIERNTAIGQLAESDAAAEDVSEDVLADDASYSVNAEMATKLDLAMAYQEIGDKEGARELLEEVMKGGNQEQAEKAKNALAKLA